ncbi:MAG: hypothetical protein HQK62_11855 [Desulfamplus sp.]|nr:hypothetical protein [Desulfamplus sp.]
MIQPVNTHKIEWRGLSNKQNPYCLFQALTKFFYAARLNLDVKPHFLPDFFGGGVKYGDNEIESISEDCMVFRKPHIYRTCVRPTSG